MKVEDFFRYLFSDDALNFLESFRQKCGDKGSLHETFKPMHFNYHFHILVLFTILLLVI